MFVDHAGHAHSRLGVRARGGGAIELIKNELSDLVVGQPRNQLADRFLGERLRQRRHFSSRGWVLRPTGKRRTKRQRHGREERDTAAKPALYVARLIGERLEHRRRSSGAIRLSAVAVVIAQELAASTC